MNILTDFAKTFLFFIVAILFVAIAFAFNSFLRPKRPTTEKMMTYECGEEPVGSPWIKFNVRFYVIALIFLIFEVEVVMLIPWALTYKEYGIYGFLVGIVFLVVLILGMLYEWKKGDLDWVRPKVLPKDLKSVNEELNKQYNKE